MTADTIRESLRGRPFRPFDIHTASGGVYHVPHPDFAWVSPSGRDLVVAADKDAVAIVSLLHITELETRPTEPSSAG